MARHRVFSYGPTVRTPRSSRIKVSSNIKSSRNGVVMRVPIGTRLGVSGTTKSVLRNKVVKGVRPPGYFTPNYKSPLD